MADSRQRDNARILVSCDTSPLGEAALDAAVALARRLDAELAGVFVENINLLRMAQLPFAREYALASAAVRRIDTSDIELMLRQQAEAMRGALSRAAQDLSLPWSFQVVRGVLLDSVLEAMREPDLAVFGYAGQYSADPDAASRKQTSRAGAAMLQPMMVLYDDTPAAGRALAAADTLAQMHHARVLVLLVAEGAGQQSQLRARATAQLEGSRAGVRFQQVGSRDYQRIKQIAAMHHVAALLWPGVRTPEERKSLAALVDELKCPVVLVS